MGHNASFIFGPTYYDFWIASRGSFGCVLYGLTFVVKTKKGLVTEESKGENRHTKSEKREIYSQNFSLHNFHQDVRWRGKCDHIRLIFEYVVGDKWSFNLNGSDQI